MEMCHEVENLHFSCIFFNMDMSVILTLISLKICVHIAETCSEGSVSQNVAIGLNLRSDEAYTFQGYKSEIGYFPYYQTL